MSNFNYIKIAEALLKGSGASINPDELRDIFNPDKTLGQSVVQLDDVLNRNRLQGDISDFLFDTLLASHLNQISADDKEDYLESDEWQRYEEKYLDRGSELLNLFIYLSEAADEGIAISLDDFLDEFLLVSDELYQDEHELYEPVIKVRESQYEPLEDFLMSPVPELDPELKAFYRPIILFFHPDFNPQKLPVDLNAEEKAVLAALIEMKGQMST